MTGLFRLAGILLLAALARAAHAADRPARMAAEQWLRSQPGRK